MWKCSFGQVTDGDEKYEINPHSANKVWGNRAIKSHSTCLPDASIIAGTENIARILMFVCHLFVQSYCTVVQSYSRTQCGGWWLCKQCADHRFVVALRPRIIWLSIVRHIFSIHRSYCSVIPNLMPLSLGADKLSYYNSMFTIN